LVSGGAVRHAGLLLDLCQLHSYLQLSGVVT
jgi:hypothetical protein